MILEDFDLLFKFCLLLMQLQLSNTSKINNSWLNCPHVSERLSEEKKQRITVPKSLQQPLLTTVTKRKSQECFSCLQKSILSHRYFK